MGYVNSWICTFAGYAVTELMWVSRVTRVTWVKRYFARVFFLFRGYEYLRYGGKELDYEIKNL